MLNGHNGKKLPALARLLVVLDKAADVADYAIEVRNHTMMLALSAGASVADLAATLHVSEEAVQEVIDLEATR